MAKAHLTKHQTKKLQAALADLIVFTNNRTVVLQSAFELLWHRPEWIEQRPRKLTKIKQEVNKAYEYQKLGLLKFLVELENVVDCKFPFLALGTIGNPDNRDEALKRYERR